MSDSGGRRWSRPEMFVAGSALLVSICALVVSVLEARMIRTETTASVWPRVTMGNNYLNNEGQPTYELTFTNVGVGPALIRSVTVELDGEVVHSWGNVLEVLDNPEAVGFQYNTINRAIITPGTRRSTLRVGGDAAVALSGAWSSDRFRVTLCYCSILDDCWAWDTEDRDSLLDPIPVGQCEYDGPRQFRQ